MVASMADTMNESANGPLLGVEWILDAKCVLTRGESGEIDSGVVGDPCIVWDEMIERWRMFYFAQMEGKDSTCMAISRSPDEVAGGDWSKEGPVEILGESEVKSLNMVHKWWVVTDARLPNHPAKINGKYLSLFVTRIPDSEPIAHSIKVIQFAEAETLNGPWKILPDLIIESDCDDFVDSLNCDTPTAYWFWERDEVLIYYKAYPRRPIAESPFSPYGSCLVSVWLDPRKRAFSAKKTVLRPQQNTWAQGWVGGLHLICRENGKWIGLINASSTPPEETCDREPAPSMGGWAICEDACPDGVWTLDTERSPFLRTENLEATAIEAGVGVNFWRHHLLIMRSGEMRIFFNSGKYGHEQMYSLVSE